MLAISLHSKGIIMSYDSLKIIMKDNNKSVHFSKNYNRGISKIVKKAYNDWKNVNPSIANTFVGRNGNFLWK